MLAKVIAGSSHAAGVEASTTTSAESAVDLLPPSEAAGAPASPEASLSAGSGVDLQQMIDSVRATIALAARQGVTQARIALQPEELGDIRIHLSQTAEGLLARVTADTPAAAQALAGGRAELHQSLSSLGVSLLRLDIGSFSQPEAGNGESRFASNPDGSNASNAAPAGAEETDDAEAPGEAPLSAALDSGGLVDVLA